MCVDSKLIQKGRAMKKKEDTKPVIYGYIRVSTAQQNLERQESNIKAFCPEAVIISDECTGKTMKRDGWLSLVGGINDQGKAVKGQIKKGDTIVFDEVSRMSRNAEEGVATYFDLYDRGVNLIFLAERHIDTDVYRQSEKQQLEERGEDEVEDYCIGFIKGLMLKIARRQIKIAFEQAEKEIRDKRQRQTAGIREQQKRNEAVKVLHPDDFEEQPDYHQIGRREGDTLTVKKKTPIMAMIKKLSKDFDGYMTDEEVMNQINAEKTTIKIEVKKRSGKTVEKETKAKISRNTFYKYKKELKEEMNGEG